MNLKFIIDYRTNWGESVYLVGDVPQLGGGDPAKALKMELVGEQSWRLNVTLPDNTGTFTYRYIVRHDNGHDRHEWGHGHTFRPGNNVREYEIFDRWQDQPFDKPYYSVVFTDCVCRRNNRALPPEIQPGKLLLTVDAPMVSPDEVVAVCGSCELLGAWNADKAVAMSDASFPTWECVLPLEALPAELEYKFLIINRNTGKLVAWEGGDNRRLALQPATSGEVIVFAGQRLVNPKAPWRGAGVAIPVFALRSAQDFGVGEFPDLIKMVDWAVATGQKFIQVLPVNDTTMTHTWTDSYPYNANSCYALHPMYLRLSELGTLADSERQAHYDALAKELNALDQIDYERVNNAKNEFTRELFKQVERSVTRTAEFKQFVTDNASWLKPYAAFCILRDENGTPDFSEWGDYAAYTPAKVEALLLENKQQANYVYWIQFNLHKQLLHLSLIHISEPTRRS